MAGPPNLTMRATLLKRRPRRIVQGLWPVLFVAMGVAQLLGGDVASGSSNMVVGLLLTCVVLLRS